MKYLGEISNSTEPKELLKNLNEFDSKNIVLIYIIHIVDCHR